MSVNFCRRAFVKQLAFGTGLGALALTSRGSVQQSGERNKAPRLLLGLAAYSFRQYFADGPDSDPVGSRDPVKGMDMFRFVDYCAEQGVLGAEVTSYFFPREITTEYLLKLKRHAFLKGVELSGTAVGNSFTYPAGSRRDRELELVKRWVDHAQILGVPHVRVFAGAAGRLSQAEAKKNCIAALEECAEYAGERGVMLGIENHGGIVAEADALLDIVRSVNSPWVGINLDTANFHTDDPYADLERCAPFAVNVQLKSELQKRGQPKEPSDLSRIVRILKEASYRGYVVLEYEAAEDPWTAVPGLLKQLEVLCRS